VRAVREFSRGDFTFLTKIIFIFKIKSFLKNFLPKISEEPKIIFCDIDNTLYSKNKIYKIFPWATEYRGMSFFSELFRRFGVEGLEIFFRIFTRDILERRIWREVKSPSSNLVILTAGILRIQREKVCRLLPPEILEKIHMTVVEKHAQKAPTIREFLKKVFAQTGKLSRVEIFDDLELPGLGEISDEFQIPVEHNLVKLD